MYDQPKILKEARKPHVIAPKASVRAGRCCTGAGVMEGQNMEELLAKVERDEAEKLQRITVQKELDLEFDLRNLLASDRNPPTELQRAGSAPESQLQALELDNTQLLINQLWQLPTEHVKEALMARLLEPTATLPQEKPVPG